MTLGKVFSKGKKRGGLMRLTVGADGGGFARKARVRAALVAVAEVAFAAVQREVPGTIA